VINSVCRGPVRPGLRYRAAGLGFFRDGPGRTVGHSPALRVSLIGPADIRGHLQISGAYSDISTYFRESEDVGYLQTKYLLIGRDMPEA